MTYISAGRIAFSGDAPACALNTGPVESAASMKGKRMSQRAGIRDVAHAAGVSVTTVSHALNGRGKVSTATRERVREAAQRLGYAPNRIASALRSQFTGIVGLVSDEVATTPFAGRIVLGAQQAAAELDMTLMLVNSNSDSEVERRQIEVLLAQQVDAILYATMFHRPVTTPLLPASVPVVLVNSEDPERSTPSFVPDEFGTAVTATQLLLDAGHRRISHLTIDAPGYPTEGRVAGYRATMAAAGLPAHVVAIRDRVAATAGREAVVRALAERPDLTAVFCFNDPMAMGVYQVAAERGIDIPRSLSIVSVDNLEIISAELRPGLTTLALPHYEMGRLALLEAVRRLRGERSSDGDVRRLKCELVQRQSVAAASSADLVD